TDFPIGLSSWELDKPKPPCAAYQHIHTIHHKEVLTMIPSSTRFDQSTMQTLLDADPLVADYRQFFALIDWTVVERWQAQQSAFCGSHGHPLSAYLKAFLIRIREGLTYSTRLRDFLLKHPLLVIE